MDQILVFLNITHREAIGIMVGGPIFFIFWKLLDAMVVQPFLNLFEMREALTNGAHDTSEETLKKAESLNQQIDIKLQQVRISAQAERASEIEAAKKSALKTVEEAEKEAAEHVHATRAALDIELKDLMKTLPATVQNFASQLAAKLKGAGGGASLHSLAAAVSTTAILFLCATATTAVAASGHEAGDHGAGTISDLFPFAVNFTLYIALLVYILRSPIKNGWRSRAEAIQLNVEKGKSEIVAAEEVYAAAKRREATLEVEIDRVKYEIRKAAKTEAQEILRDGQERAFRIREQGKNLAQGDINHQRIDYKKELSRKVVELATAMLRKEISPEVDLGLRRAAIKNVESKLGQVVIQ